MVRKNVLLVGLQYAGTPLPQTNIDVLGLCRPEVCESKSAYVLYEYDLIIINPESYSHFLFGGATSFSSSEKELWDLKAHNNDYDLDSAYDESDRQAEMSAAIAQGTRVVWLLQPEKRTHFFGWRSLYSGYANAKIARIVRSSSLYVKKSKRVVIRDGEVGEFKPYFEQLRKDGWRLCISDFGDALTPIAETPEGYCLGAKVLLGESTAWLLTPPTTQEAANVLVQCALGIDAKEVNQSRYHGIFLSHTAADKSFVCKLKADLEAHGVRDVWVDEAEIQIGDSLTKKIEEGLKRTRYIGVVLSPRSIKSPWVERELEIAIEREISTGEVVVLPLLYEKCELPPFLRTKMYADFTSPTEYYENLRKLLRRLKVS